MVKQTQRKMKMIYLIIDTNNWIYLANSKNPLTGNYEDGPHLKLFSALKEKIDSKEIEILLCPIIEAEWHRNKEAAEELIREYNKTIKEYRDVIKSIKRGLIIDEDKSMLTALFEKYEVNKKLQIQENKKHILKIEEIIIKSIKL